MVSSSISCRSLDGDAEPLAGSAWNVLAVLLGRAVWNVELFWGFEDRYCSSNEIIPRLQHGIKFITSKRS